MYHYPSAFVSSSMQLAVSDTMGIGASGFVYAMFGFMWGSRHRYALFNEVIDQRIIQWFLGWMVFCVAMNYAGIWNVGNTAHSSGLLFGLAAAGASIGQTERRPLFAAGVGALILGAIVPLFWSPWSAGWLSQQAFEAHDRGRYAEALARYNQVLRIQPENAWAYLNRSFVHQSLHKPDLATADLEKARTLDPTIEAGISE